MTTVTGQRPQRFNTLILDYLHMHVFKLQLIAAVAPGEKNAPYRPTKKLKLMNVKTVSLSINLNIFGFCLVSISAISLYVNSFRKATSVKCKQPRWLMKMNWCDSQTRGLYLHIPSRSSF